VALSGYVGVSRTQPNLSGFAGVLESPSVPSGRVSRDSTWAPSGSSQTTALSRATAAR
jgi:hypothetical protein